ncbi:hypothetical protein Tco_1217010 [Tanacetum coccineum]
MLLSKLVFMLAGEFRIPPGILLKLDVWNTALLYSFDVSVLNFYRFLDGTKLVVDLDLIQRNVKRLVRQTLLQVRRYLQLSPVDRCLTLMTIKCLEWCSINAGAITVVVRNSTKVADKRRSYPDVYSSFLDWVAILPRRLKSADVRLLSARFYVLAIIASFALTSCPLEILTVQESPNLHYSNSLTDKSIEGNLLVSSHERFLGFLLYNEAANVIALVGNCPRVTSGIIRFLD